MHIDPNFGGDSSITVPPVIGYFDVLHFSPELIQIWYLEQVLGTSFYGNKLLNCLDPIYIPYFDELSNIVQRNYSKTRIWR